MTTESQDHEHWCFAWHEDNALGSGVTAKAAIVRANKWAKRAIIKVGFLDGTPAQQALVKRFAVGWIAPGMARLKFAWTTADKADIRISFAYRGSWSVIGTSCKSVPKSQPTMNFGWLTPTVSDAEAQRVILHEFGHALGLIHEHQNPMGAVNWNKPAVYQDLSGPPNSWDKAKIDHNMFEAYPLHEIEGTRVDPASIMMYPIPASWVNPPSQPVGLNSVLSARDIAYIKSAYP
jgi:hypothetical protein